MRPLFVPLPGLHRIRLPSVGSCSPASPATVEGPDFSGSCIPHLRRELGHAAPQPDRHNCSTTSAAALGTISSCSLCPLGPCSDSRQPLVLTGSAGPLDEPHRGLNRRPFGPATDASDSTAAGAVYFGV